MSQPNSRAVSRRAFSRGLSATSPVIATKPAPRSLASRADIRPSGPGPSTSTDPPSGMSALITEVRETASGSVRQAET